MRWAALLVIAILLSGCSGGARLSEAEARDITEDAVEDFAREIASADGGRLRLVHGQIEGGAVPGVVHFEMEWGTDGQARVALEAASAGQSYEVEMHCSMQRFILSFGEMHLERRATGEGCLGSLDGSDPLEVDELAQGDILSVAPHGDGSITAVLARDGENITVEVDPEGRLERMEFLTDEGSGTIDIEYGKRQALAPPEPTGRIPLTVDGVGSFEDGRYTWTGIPGNESAPFDEIQIRIVNPGGAQAAVFFASPGSQSLSGFTLIFQDDGDGVFDGGDSFSVEGDAWTEPGQYDVVLWDAWADAEVGDVPIPSLPLLLGFVVVGLLAARRR